MKRCVSTAIVALFALAVLLSPSLKASKGSSGSSKGSGTKSVHVKGYTKKNGTHVAPHTRSAAKGRPIPPAPPPSSTTTTTASTQDAAHGRIEGSEAAKHQVEVKSGSPRGRPGYVVDHIRPLACGGADTPSNMQRQTIGEAKAKDKTERF